VNYIEYYENNIDSSNKYTEKEKEIIKNILMSLETNRAPEVLKEQYMIKLENILFSINNLNDSETNNNIIRPGYYRRLETLLDEINNKRNIDESIDKEEIEKQIVSFNNEYEQIVEKLKQIQDRFDSSIEVIDILKLKSSINAINRDFISFFGNTGKNVSALIDAINKFNDSQSNAKLSIDASIIDEKITFVKNTIKDIKIRYIKKYNAIIEDTNKKIDKLQMSTNIDSTTIEKVQNLQKLSTYEVPKNFAFNNQLKNIKNRKLIETIELINKLNNPNVSKPTNANIFDLESKIENLNATIDNLNEQINRLETPIIKDKETRGNINKIISKCEDEIDNCRRYLDLYKNDNNDKYNSTILKINELDKKMIDVSILYRSKCPLLVKRVKSAKDLYKKNEKLPLIASGLAGLSLIDFVVGPIIVPAIMCGNLMLARKNSKFSNIVNGINKVLARFIDAKKTENGYILHTGVELNEATASASILKTIAVSEGREWITPLVNSAKNLFEKIKLAKLKENISKGISSTKEHIVNAKDSVKTGVREIKDKVSSSTKIRENLVEIKEMIKEFQKSKLSLDDFCQQNNVSANDRIMLEKLNGRIRG